MAEPGWNPWKLTAIGMALVLVTAFVTGIVVAYWTGSEPHREGSSGLPPMPSAPVAVSRPAVPPPAPSARPARVATAPVPAGRPRAVLSAPTPADIEACNRYAEAQAGEHDKTAEVVKDALIGAVGGAAIGAAGGAIADGGKGAGKGAAIGGVVGAGVGSLYGLNENKTHDQAYREAYATCMRSRGYTG